MANEIDKALEEIRREVIEGRNLVIKTDNLLKNLHAELKTVAKRQDDFQRKQWISSGVAYVAFVALCVAAAIAVTKTASAGGEAERERLEKQVADLGAKLEAERATASAEAASERAAFDVYKMMTTLAGDDRLKGVDALARVDLTKVSSFAKQVLQDRAQLLRKEVGAGALERGRTAFRRQEWANAVSELTRFLALGPADDDAVEASYYLGNALVQQRKNEDAIPHLTRFVQGDRHAKNRDYAMLLLAQAHDAANQHDKAVEVAREALSQYPSSEFAQGLRNRTQRRSATGSGGGDGASDAGPR